MKSVALIILFLTSLCADECENIMHKFDKHIKLAIPENQNAPVKCSELKLSLELLKDIPNQTCLLPKDYDGLVFETKRIYYSYCLPSLVERMKVQ